MRGALCAALVSASACGLACAQTPNALTAEERAQGFRLLFDGRSTAGWRAYRADTVPSGWRVVDGTLSRVGPGGDLVTREAYADFELRLEWMVQPGGNSGVFLRAEELPDEAIYWSALEMQVLDNARHPDGRSPLTSAGAAYALYPAPAGAVRPAGQWNSAVARVEGNHVEMWLNGVRTVDCVLWSDDFTRRLAASKFAPHARFARATTGLIGLQDHGDRVAFRTIRIRVLP